MLSNRIIETRLIDWRTIKPLQPELLKHQFNTEYIERSLNKHGFAMPFFVWEYKGDIYAIDGHTRVEVLNGMENVPEQLPATFINAKNKKEAIKILLDVFNQKQNPIDEPVLEEWLGSEEIQVDEVEIETLNLKKELRNIIGNDYEAEREINNKDYCMVYLEKSHLAILEKLKDTKGFSDNEEAILYLIENSK